MPATDSKSRFTFFFPGARVLKREEVASLPAEKRASAEGQEGIWVEFDCPDGSCVEEGRIRVPAEGVKAGKGKGTWLNLFCPEDSCEIRQPTDVP